MIRELTARDGALDKATGWLYAINTFGAAAGCYLAGFQLLPTIGLLWTINLAAALNVTIGLVAVWIAGLVPARAPRKCAAARSARSVAGRDASLASTVHRGSRCRGWRLWFSK